MAFDVTPSSGAAPYFMSAVINDVHLIDGVNYTASVRSSINTGTCPATGQASILDPSFVDPMIAGQSVELTTTTIASGSCRTWSLYITRVADNVVVASASSSVSNI